jgi:hypothetical protein
MKTSIGIAAVVAEVITDHIKGPYKFTSNTLCIDRTYAHLTLKSLQTLTIITVSLNI